MSTSALRPLWVEFSDAAAAADRHDRETPLPAAAAGSNCIETIPLPARKRS
jgi:hypothetical protein